MQDESLKIINRRSLRFEVPQQSTEATLLQSFRPPPANHPFPLPQRDHDKQRTL